MPELPEVESVRRTLTKHLVGQRIIRVKLRRPSVITGQKPPQALLVGERVIDVIRHGKQLAIASETGRCVCVHLGMTGRLTVARSQAPTPPHTHVVWNLEDGGNLRFIDPRRFGGLWTFASLDALHAHRWASLGDDALTIRPKKLHDGLSRTQRALKAALLDQSLIAGLGNIYVDELLFTRRLHPTRQADTLRVEETRELVRSMRLLLNRAIRCGGSTLRDYADANGMPGEYQWRHRVYGRGGQPCIRCRRVLETFQVAGRTTVACKVCQAMTTAAFSGGRQPPRIGPDGHR